MAIPSYWSDIVDTEKLIRLFQILQDGALTPKEAREFLDVMVLVLTEIRPHLKRFWLRIMLDGIACSLMELREHLEDE